MTKPALHIIVAFALATALVSCGQRERDLFVDLEDPPAQTAEQR